ncbi:MAG: hypothetical protein Kow0089_03660 [Desulfobulbaceae bacterium]
MITALSMTDRFGTAKHNGSQASPSRRGGGWPALAACLFLLWAFAFILAPWLQNRSETIRTLSDYIESSGIDAGAIYYTEVAEVGEADLMIRDTFRFYLPQQEPGKISEEP